jgi:hypothetical protein
MDMVLRSLRALATSPDEAALVARRPGRTSLDVCPTGHPRPASPTAPTRAATDLQPPTAPPAGDPVVGGGGLHGES